MTNKQNLPNDNASSPSQIPVTWRIGIAVIAAVIILALVWQFFGRRTAPATPPQAGPEAGSTTGAVATANPSSPEAMFQLGNSHYQAGEWDKAIAAYRQAIELNPNYDAAYANLGAVYYAQQKLDLAEETYLKAISLAPNDADVIYNLGAIYLQQAVSTGIPDQAKLAQAVAKINKAIELNPDLAEPYYGLGVANQLLGENDAAIEAFETFLKLDDGSDPIATSKATEILQKLKSGQGQ